MIYNSLIFNTLSKVINDPSAERVTSAGLQERVSAWGKPYEVYFQKRKEKRKKGAAIPAVRLGRVVAGPNEWYAGLLDVWIRLDAYSARVIMESYDEHYAAVRERADEREKKNAVFIEEE